MELDRGSTEQHLLERGSAALEGVAAIAIVFILFTVMAQAATAFLAHRTAQAAVAASATRLAVVQDRAIESGRLRGDLESTVPGASDIEVELSIGSSTVRSLARFVFVPPGPLFDAIEVEVKSDAPIVVEP